MSLWTLYLLAILPNAAKLAAGMILLGGLLGGLAAFGMLFSSVEEDFPKDVPLKGLRYSAITLIVGGVLSLIAPTERNLYLMLGGYAATNIEGIEKLPKSMVDAADAWLKELKESASKVDEKSSGEEL